MINDCLIVNKFGPKTPKRNLISFNLLTFDKKMDISNIPKYWGNIHPDEWINDIQQYYIIKGIGINDYIYLNIAKSLVDSTISLPTEINSLEKLRNALKEDVSFTIFKCINKRKLQLLKYITKRKGGTN